MIVVRLFIAVVFSGLSTVAFAQGSSCNEELVVKLHDAMRSSDTGEAASVLRDFTAEVNSKAADAIPCVRKFVKRALVDGRSGATGAAEELYRQVRKVASPPVGTSLKNATVCTISELVALESEIGDYRSVLKTYDDYHKVAMPILKREIRCLAQYVPEVVEALVTGGRLDEARVVVKEALAVSSLPPVDRAALQAAYGSALLARGEQSSAFAAFDQALKFDSTSPTSAIAEYWLATEALAEGKQAACTARVSRVEKLLVGVIDLWAQELRERAADLAVQCAGQISTPVTKIVRERTTRDREFLGKTAGQRN